MKNILLLLCSVLSVWPVWAVGPDVILRRHYDVRADLSTIIPADTLPLPRSFYVSGTAVEGQFQFYLVKIDSMADTIWTRRLGTTDQAYTMSYGLNRNLLLAGQTFEDGTIDYRFRLLSDSGSTIANVHFGADTASERVRTVFTQSDGHYVLGGETVHSGISDVTLLQVNSFGNLDWSRTFPTGWRLTNVFRIESPNSMRLVGTADSVDGLGSDFWVLDADSAGIGFWFRRYGSGFSEVAAEAYRRPSGYTTIAGTVRNGTLRDVWIVTLNSTSDSVRSNYWRTTGDDIATCIVEAGDPDSGFVVGGYSIQDSVQRGFLARFSGRGDSLWTVWIDDELGVRIADIYRDPTQRYHAVGSLLTSAGQRGFYIQTDPDPESPGQHPPNRFSLLAPAMGDSVTSDTVFFDWEDAFDPDGDPVHYTVMIDTDTLFQVPYQVFGPLTNSRYRWASDSDDVNLYWRIIAADQFNNNRICSDPYRWFWRFLPDSTEPFHLVEPDSGTALRHLQQRFSWRRAVDADLNDSIRYTIHFATADTNLQIVGLRDTFVSVSFEDTVVFPRISSVEWYVTAHSFFDTMTVHSTETWNFVTWSLSGEETVSLPNDFGIASIYPNPFNSITSIVYRTRADGPVLIELYDVGGRLVETLVDRVEVAGEHRIIWNAHAQATGIYFARLSAGTETAIQKLLLLK